MPKVALLAMGWCSIALYAGLIEGSSDIARVLLSTLARGCMAAAAHAHVLWRPLACLVLHRQLPQKGRDHHPRPNLKVAMGVAPAPDRKSWSKALLKQDQSLRRDVPCLALYVMVYIDDATVPRRPCLQDLLRPGMFLKEGNSSPYNSHVLLLLMRLLLLNCAFTIQYSP